MGEAKGTGEGGDATKAHSWPLFALRLLILLAFVGLGALAAMRRAEYFDAYEYRTASLYLLGAPNTNWPDYRPPLMALLELPFMAAKQLGWFRLAWLGPHLISAAAAGICVLFTARIAQRLGATKETAALAAAILLGDRLLWHYAPSGMSGIPAAALAAVALYQLLKAIDQPDARPWFILALLCGLGALLRLNLALLTVLMLGVHCYQRGARKDWGERIALGATALGTYLCISWLCGARKHGLSVDLLLSPFHYILHRGDYAGDQYGTAGYGFYLQATFLAFGFLAPCLAAIGASLQRNRQSTTLLVWLLGHDLLLALLYGHGEARYSLVVHRRRSRARGCCRREG